MSSTLSNLVVDASSALGARVLTLLRLSTHAAPFGDAPLSNARVLLIDANAATIARALAQGAQHVIDLRHAAATPLSAASSRVSTLLAHPHQESLFPRLKQAQKSGVFYTAAARRSTAYVALEDVAMVAALSLASDDESASTLSLSGPRAYDHHELCGAAMRILGRRLIVQEVPPDALGSALVESGMPPHEALAAAADDVALNAHTWGVTDHVARSTGMLPLSLTSVLRRERNALLEFPLEARARSRAQATASSVTQ